MRKFLLKPGFVSVRGSRPGKNVQLTETEIRGLCLKSRELFLSQPILLELEAPLKICGEFNSNLSNLGDWLSLTESKEMITFTCLQHNVVPCFVSLQNPLSWELWRVLYSRMPYGLCKHMLLLIRLYNLYSSWRPFFIMYGVSNYLEVFADRL